MARILVLYYSSYGHLAQMADAVAEGVRQAGHDAEVLRVPETAPPEVAAGAGFRVADHHTEISTQDARQGKELGVMRWVLHISLGLSVLAGIVLLIWFTR